MEDNAREPWLARLLDAISGKTMDVRVAIEPRPAADTRFVDECVLVVVDPVAAQLG